MPLGSEVGRTSLSTVECTVVSALSPRVQVTLPVVPEAALRAAREIAGTSGRRAHTPVRKSFVRSDRESSTAPMGVLLKTGGRGGGVSIKLMLALLWRCSSTPHSTQVSARQWASLLGLADPARLGARRVADALGALEGRGLITVTRRRGEPSLVQLREESGSGDEYRIPSTAYTKAVAEDKQRHLYFKVPTPLWTNGHIQAMSTPALAMLLIILAEQGGDAKEVWWSTEVFPARYSISPATRAKGTRELVERGLLVLTKRLVSDSTAARSSFASERVRNVYRLTGDALLPPASPSGSPRALRRGGLATTQGIRVGAVALPRRRRR